MLGKEDYSYYSVKVKACFWELFVWDGGMDASSSAKKKKIRLAFRV